VGKELAFCLGKSEICSPTADLTHGMTAAFLAFFEATD
jgi:hypothetical protein